MLNTQVTGIDKLMQTLDSLPRDLRVQVLDDALDQAAERVKAVMVAEAPESRDGSKGNKKTKDKDGKKRSTDHSRGNLKRSIGITKSKGVGDFPTRYIRPGTTNGIDAFYAMMVERGHAVREGGFKGKKEKLKNVRVMYIPPNPFMRRTADKMDAWVKNYLDVKVKEGVIKLMAK